MFGSQLSEKKSLKIILLVLISSVLAYTTIDLALGSNSWIAIAIAFPTWIGIFSGKGRQAHNWGTEQLETSVGFYVGFTINIFILGALYFWFLYRVFLKDQGSDA